MQQTAQWRAQRKLLGWLSVLVVALTLLGLFPGVYAARQIGPTMVYFAETGHHLDNQYGFLDYWRANGQLVRFGYPITEVMIEDGRPVQYFERARMEYHADIPDPAQRVLLGLLGRELSQDTQYPTGPVQSGRVFAETGYTVLGKFLQYWQSWGALDSFGYPVSESFVTTLPDGSRTAVQWFERGRLEYRPETLPAFYQERRTANGTRMLGLYELQMGLVGREAAQARGYDLQPVARRGDAPQWSPALWPQRIEVDLSEQRLSAYEGDLLVFQSGVSTGKDGFATVTGEFQVYAKLLYDDMSGNLRGEEYDVRKVPYVLYFYQGFAIHGTYWHDEFGTGVRRSHGCVNLPLDRAQWLWQWVQPAWDPNAAQRFGSATSRTPDTPTEAELQALEGRAIVQPGTPVFVRR